MVGRRSTVCLCVIRSDIIYVMHVTCNIKMPMTRLVVLFLESTFSYLQLIQCIPGRQSTMQCSCHVHVHSVASYNLSGILRILPQ